MDKIYNCKNSAMEVMEINKISVCFLDGKPFIKLSDLKKITGINTQVARDLMKKIEYGLMYRSNEPAMTTSSFKPKYFYIINEIACIESVKAHTKLKYDVKEEAIGKINEFFSKLPDSQKSTINYYNVTIYGVNEFTDSNEFLISAKTPKEAIIKLFESETGKDLNRKTHAHIQFGIDDRTKIFD